jgi:hypothetical protein
VEAGSKTSNKALPVVGGDEIIKKYLGHPVPGGYKYGYLALYVGASKM